MTNFNEKEQAALDCIQLHDDVFMHPEEQGYYKEDMLYLSDRGTLYIEVKTTKGIKRAGVAGRQRIPLGKVPRHVHTAVCLLRMCSIRLDVLMGKHNLSNNRLIFARYLYSKGIIGEEI